MQATHGKKLCPAASLWALNSRIKKIKTLLSF